MYIRLRLVCSVRLVPRNFCYPRLSRSLCLVLTNFSYQRLLGGINSVLLRCSSTHFGSTYVYTPSPCLLGAPCPTKFLLSETFSLALPCLDEFFLPRLLGGINSELRPCPRRKGKVCFHGLSFSLLKGAYFLICVVDF